MAYIVMDLEDANVVDECATEREALEFVHATIDKYGERAVAHWAIGPADRSRPPIRGDELIDRARAVPA
ncbi:MAG TPA: hypothetical protein VKV26_25840 [Dehalococcoidia bacterium]|nr:hypothetical protein [Dehalococcoidia bacterium]